MTLPQRIGALLAACALGATTLTCAPAASAVPGDNAAVVNAWYQDFLYRPAYGDDGARIWLDRLNVQAPADVLWEISHSREANTAVITNYYNVLLERDPDRGANYWIEGTTAQRFPLEWVLQNIVASSEYRRLHRYDFVDSWYFTAYGDDDARANPATGAVMYWNSRVDAVGSLGAYREFYYSPEIVNSRVEANYSFLLYREPSGGEFAYWYPKEVESDINVAVLIASTPEYRSLTQ